MVVWPLWVARLPLRSPRRWCHIRVGYTYFLPLGKRHLLALRGFIGRISLLGLYLHRLTQALLRRRPLLLTAICGSGSGGRTWRGAGGIGFFWGRSGFWLLPIGRGGAQQLRSRLWPNGQGTRQAAHQEDRAEHSCGEEGQPGAGCPNGATSRQQATYGAQPPTYR